MVYTLKTVEGKILTHPHIIISANDEYGQTIRILIPGGQVVDIAIPPDYDEENLVVYVGLTKPKED